VVGETLSTTPSGAVHLPAAAEWTGRVTMDGGLLDAGPDDVGREGERVRSEPPSTGTGVRTAW
jgi:hypothetical protein